MNDDRKASLSDAGLESLLSRMRTAEPAVASAPVRVARPRHDDLRTFDSHPLYQQMKVQRGFAAIAGLRDPYYHLHEEKAGALARIEGKRVLNFASYDYLGLNGHPEILAAVDAAQREFGTSVSASRISAGERQPHRDLERELARNYEAEDCIAFVSGHAAAVSTLATLYGPRDLIVHDALIHNCILVGAQLSGAGRRVFPHNDLDALDTLLAKERDRFERVLIVSEGLFSMDGDGPDLARLVALKNEYSAMLMIDDAHGLGVLGATGRGLHEHQSVSPVGVDLWLGTLSKALVSCGGYVAGSTVAVDILKHLAPGFVYSVGMPASAAVASTVALDLMRREPWRVEKLQENSRYFHARARAAGLDVAESWGYGVIPVVVGDTVRTLMLSERLLARGVNAFPILPPGVPDKSARLRFFINATHEKAQLDEAVAATATELAALRDVSLDRVIRR